MVISTDSQIPLSMQWENQIKKEHSLKTRGAMFLHSVNVTKTLEEDLSPNHLSRWEEVKKMLFSSTDYFKPSEIGGGDSRDLPEGFAGVMAFTKTQSSIFHWQDIPQIILNQIAFLCKMSHLPQPADLYDSLQETLKDITSDVPPQWPVLAGLTEETRLQIESPLFQLYLGIGYMYASQYVDLSVAQSLFRRASKQLVSHIHATSIQDRAHVNQEDSLLEEEQYLILGSEAYYLIALTCFLQDQFKEAASFINKAISLSPGFQSATLLKAKISLAMRKEEETLTLLQSLFAEDPYTLEQICLEIDFILNPAIFSWVQALQDDKKRTVEGKINEIKKNIVPNSQAQQVLRNIESISELGSFFYLLLAEQELDKENEFQIKEAISGSEEYPYINIEVLNLPIKEFVEKEKYYASKLPAVKARQAELVANSEATKRENAKNKRIREIRDGARGTAISMGVLGGIAGLLGGCVSGCNDHGISIASLGDTLLGGILGGLGGAILVGIVIFVQIRLIEQFK